MSKAIFNQIKDLNGYPCVTMIMPSHRSKPGSLQDPTRLSNLIREAHQRLTKEFSEEEIAPIFKQIERVQADLDHNYNQEGLIVFANRDMGTFARVPFDVEERVVIDHNFATRDLIRGFYLVESYYVMTLSWNQIRLFHGVGHQIQEIRSHGFPFDHDFGVTDRIDWSISDYENAQLREFFNRVDKAFFDLYQEQPGEWVIAGVTENLGHYREIADRSDLIFAQIHGNFDEASPHEIAAKAWPVVKQKLDEQKTQAVADLEEAFGSQKASTGIQEVYELARQGRGDTLLVEQNFFQPARLKVDSMGMPHPVLDVDPKAPDAIDDLVDEIAKQVVEHQGEVIFVDDGTLSDHGHIAMILRY